MTQCLVRAPLIPAWDERTAPHLAVATALTPTLTRSHCHLRPPLQRHLPHGPAPVPPSLPDPAPLHRGSSLSTSTSSASTFLLSILRPPSSFPPHPLLSGVLPWSHGCPPFSSRGSPFSCHLIRALKVPLNCLPHPHFPILPLPQHFSCVKSVGT